MMVRRKGGKKGGKVKRMPPALETVVCAHTVLRFNNQNAASNVNVTAATLLVACGSICTIANSTVVSVASAFKLHKITVWPGSTSAGAGQVAEVLFPDLGGITKDESRSTAIPTGVTVSDVVTERPPKNTQASWWNNSTVGSSVIATITCPAGSIVDVSITFTLRNNIAGVVQAGYAAATLGAYYYGRLDGVGGKFTPMGAPTTN